jgi:hypothetical protein
MLGKFRKYKRIFISVVAIAVVASKSSAIGESLNFVPKSQYIRFNSELNCVEAFVRASVPVDSTAKAAERILEARERAELLFYVKLVDFLFGAQIEGWDMRQSTMHLGDGKNKIDRVSANAVQTIRERNVGGHIMRNVELSPLQWDGRFFEIYARFPMPQTSRTQEKAEEKAEKQAEKQVKPAKSGKKAPRRK